MEQMHKTMTVRRGNYGALSTVCLQYQCVKVRKKYQYHRCSCTLTIKDVCHHGNPKNLEAGLWRKDEIFVILYMEILCEYWLLCQITISTYSLSVSLSKIFARLSFDYWIALAGWDSFWLACGDLCTFSEFRFWCHKFGCPVNILILLKIKSLHPYFESQKCICLLILCHFPVWYLKQRDSWFSPVVEI